MALGAHHRDDLVGEFDGAEEVGLELLSQHFAAEVFHRPGLAVGAVVEQRV